MLNAFLDTFTSKMNMAEGGEQDATILQANVGCDKINTSLKLQYMILLSFFMIAFTKLPFSVSYLSVKSVVSLFLVVMWYIVLYSVTYLSLCTL